jgi:hypothetical protein
MARAIDPAVELDGVGLKSHVLGLGTCSSSIEDPSTPVEGVMACAVGYWD